MKIYPVPFAFPTPSRKGKNRPLEKGTSKILTAYIRLAILALYTLPGSCCQYFSPDSSAGLMLLHSSYPTPV